MTAGKLKIQRKLYYLHKATLWLVSSVSALSYAVEARIHELTVVAVIHIEAKLMDPDLQA